MADYDLLEIEMLRDDTALPAFSFDSFYEFHATENDYGTSKRARTVKASYIVVYSVWNNNLLARTFYIEEYFEKKQIHNLCYEVNRQLAGNRYKLHCRLTNSGFGGYGFKVWKGIDTKGWQVAPYNRFHCYGLVNNYSGKGYIDYYQFNDPYMYLSCTKHKYCGCTKEYPKYHNNDLFEYLYKYNKHPQLEMLMKMKLGHLVENLQGFKWSQKGLGIIGIDKWEIPYLQHFKLTDYRLIREYVQKWKLTVAQAKIAYDLKMYSFNVTRRLIRYFEEENVTTYNYQDYLHYLDLLGLPHENKYLYPKNFHEAHQRQIDRYKVEQNKGVDEAIKAMSDNLLNKYGLDNELFVIRPAASYEELINEGKVLHHCVATYGNRMANGECVIMLIRKKEHEDDPLYTLEFKNNKVIQCRGLHNSKPEDSALAFVRTWAQKNRLECNL